MENQAIEWKESWHDEHMRTICAFANASGGVIEVGRRDNGEITGVSDAAKLLEDLPNKIKNAMAIIPDVEALESDGKQYIRIGVGAYPFPISYHGVYYIRSGSTTQALTGSALDEFILRKHGKTWDAVPEPYAKFDDFEKDAFRAFRRKAIGSARLTEQDLEITDEVLLDNLMCTERNYLKRAAVLLFHQNPGKWVYGSYIKIGMFANAADLIYQDEIHGPLITMADKVEETVYLKYFKGLISYQGIQRIETYPIPRAAFREAVLNAIVHKDYSTGNPIHIHIYPNKVLIYNDGRLPDNWTADNLFAPHTSKPYNPLIAGAFFRSGQIEAWGRGIQKITGACRAWGKPDPFYKICSNEVMIGFHVDPAGIVGSDGESVGVNEGGIVEKDLSIVESAEKGEKFGKEFGINDENFGVNGDSIVESAENGEKFGVNSEDFGVNGGNFGVNGEEFGKEFGIDGKSVGVNEESVGVSGKGVGIDGKSVGVNEESVGVNGEVFGKEFGINGGISEIQKQILIMMMQDPEIITDKIAESIGVTRRHIEKNVRQLKALEILQRVGGRKSGHWVVKTQKNGGERV